MLSRRVRPGANRVAVALRLAAGSVHHSQSALGALFRRLRARLGAPKAITATAHKLARLVYSLLKHGTASVQQGMEAYEAQYRERKVKAMARQAKAFGYTLVPLAMEDGQTLHAVLGSTPSKRTTRRRQSNPLWGKGGSVPAIGSKKRWEMLSPSQHPQPHGGVPWEAQTQSAGMDLIRNPSPTRFSRVPLS